MASLVAPVKQLMVHSKLIFAIYLFEVPTGVEVAVGDTSWLELENGEVPEYDKEYIVFWPGKAGREKHSCTAILFSDDKIFLNQLCSKFLKEDIDLDDIKKHRFGQQAEISADVDGTVPKTKSGRVPKPTEKKAAATISKQQESASAANKAPQKQSKKELSLIQSKAVLTNINTRQERDTWDLIDDEEDEENLPPVTKKTKLANETQQLFKSSLVKKSTLGASTNYSVCNCSNCDRLEAKIALYESIEKLKSMASFLKSVPSVPTSSKQGSVFRYEEDPFSKKLGGGHPSKQPKRSLEQYEGAEYGLLDDSFESRNENTVKLGEKATVLNLRENPAIQDSVPETSKFDLLNKQNVNKLDDDTSPVSRSDVLEPELGNERNQKVIEEPAAEDNNDRKENSETENDVAITLPLISEDILDGVSSKLQLSAFIAQVMLAEYGINYLKNTKMTSKGDQNRTAMKPAELTRLINSIKKCRPNADDGQIRKAIGLKFNNSRCDFYLGELTEDVEINGYKLPSGATAALFITSIHHNPRIYPDPEAFNPERFLPENSVGRHPFAFIPFSAGPRNCIGQKYAMIEMKVFLANFLRRFRFSLPQAAEPIVPSYHVLLKPSDKVRLVISKRLIKK